MSKAESKDNAERDFIAAERDAKYKAWLQSKTLRDRALECLGRLDKRRSSEEESCREVAMSMCAIQRLMGADGSGSGGGEGNEENEMDNAAAPKVRACVHGRQEKHPLKRLPCRFSPFSLIKECLQPPF